MGDLKSPCVATAFLNCASVFMNERQQRHTHVCGRISAQNDFEYHAINYACNVSISRKVIKGFKV